VAAFFTAVVCAKPTGVVLMRDMTGGWQSPVADVYARRLGDTCIGVNACGGSGPLDPEAITALGYGYVVLPPPWRILGPLVAISGTLMFGCSTAFLFLVLQKVWVLDL
jgi:hypothetical protein